MSTLTLRGAAQVLLPPEDGLAHLRHDRAADLRLEPGSVAARDGMIAALGARALLATVETLA